MFRLHVRFLVRATFCALLNVDVQISGQVKIREQVSNQDEFPEFIAVEAPTTASRPGTRGSTPADSSDEVEVDGGVKDENAIDAEPLLNAKDVTTTKKSKKKSRGIFKKGIFDGIVKTLRNFDFGFRYIAAMQ